MKSRLTTLSASLWGCELKCQIIHTRTQIIKVSLLVRLWVEIRPCGCGRMPQRCQPPCEAVSWNVLYHSVISQSRLSASLWGCELKSQTLELSTVRSGCQPPCEAVSWNILNHPCRGRALRVSLLVRLWVEILSVLLYVYKVNVSLLVRLWVEMFPNTT